MSLAAMNAREQAGHLDYLNEVALVVHNSSVQIVCWTDSARLIGFPILVDESCGLKWSLPGLRPQLGLGLRSFETAEIVLRACGVAHRRSVFRPVLPDHVQRLRRMCFIAVDGLDSIEPWCSFCESIADLSECCFCTLRMCNSCRDLGATLATLHDPQELQRPAQRVVPQCMIDTSKFVCAQCSGFFL